jgi:hypothetical protein
MSATPPTGTERWNDLPPSRRTAENTWASRRPVLRISLRNLMIGIAFVAVIFGLYTQNVVERERQFRREWAAWQAALAVKTAHRAQRLAHRVEIDRQKAAESLHQIQEHPDQSPTWRAEAAFWQRQAARDSARARQLQREAQTWRNPTP